MMVDESHLEFFFPFNHLDDSSFNLALYEISHGPLNFNSDRLETLLFNPIEQPELSNSLSSYLNPDSNFLAGLPSSSYLTEDDINSRVAPLSNKINFSVMHLNARSLLKNLDQLNLMLLKFQKIILCDWYFRNVADRLHCRAGQYLRIQFYLKSSQIQNWWRSRLLFTQ